jgi:hypothetical protein
MMPLDETLALAEIFGVRALAAEYEPTPRGGYLYVFTDLEGQMRGFFREAIRFALRRVEGAPYVFVRVLNYAVAP